MSLADLRATVNAAPPPRPALVDARVVGAAGWLGAGWLTEALVARLAQVVFLAFVCFSAAGAWVKPLYDWDTVAYVAVAMEPDYADPAALHRDAFALIEKHAAPAGKWYFFTAENEYKAHQYASAESFVSQLPMYRVKPAYVAAIRALSGVADPFVATKIIAVLSTLGAGLVAFWWMSRHGFAQAGLLLAPVMALGGFFHMALLATPDMPYAALGLAGLYLLAKGRDWAAVPLLLAMFLMRVDAIILLFALLLAGLAFRTAVKPLAVTFAVALAAYFAISAAAGHIGWWPHFVFSNIEIQNTLVGFAPEFSLKVYLEGIFRGVVLAVRDYNWPAMMLVFIAGGLMLVRGGVRFERRAAMLLLALLLAFGGKFVTFPLPVDRNYFLFVVATALVLLEAWKPRMDLAALARPGR